MSLPLKTDILQSSRRKYAAAYLTVLNIHLIVQNSNS